MNLAGIRYAVTGSVATIFYGEPRLTNDVDFVVFLNDADISRLPNAFPAADYYLPPAEVITVEARREQRGHFNIIHLDSGLKADLYLAGRDELNAWALKARREARFGEEPVSLAPPEYVIVRKLEYYREGGSDKHLRDIRSILALQDNKLDASALNDWIGRLRLEPEWRIAQS